MKNPTMVDGYADVPGEFRCSEPLRASLMLYWLVLVCVGVGALTALQLWTPGKGFMFALVIVATGIIMRFGWFRWSRLRRVADEAMLSSHADASIIFTAMARTSQPRSQMVHKGYLLLVEGELRVVGLGFGKGAAEVRAARRASDVVSVLRVDRGRGWMVPIMAIAWGDEQWRFALPPQRGPSVASPSKLEVDVLVRTLEDWVQRNR